VSYSSAVSRKNAIAVGLIVAAVAASAGFVLWDQAQDRAAEEAARIRRERDERRRAQRDRERLERLREESSAMIPDMLGDLALGMTLDELRAARRVQPKLGTADPSQEFYQERLPNGAEVVYGVAKDSRRLVQIQVQSVLPSAEAVSAHVTAMTETYGRPTGLWDCPNTGGVPTRRFTWRRAHTSIADVFLVYGNRVSVTLYIAPTDVIAGSLRLGACRPVRTPEELAAFPVTTVEQIMATQEEGNEPSKQP
jgi:hypothetical protein